MNLKKILAIGIALVALMPATQAQDTLLTQMAKKHVKTFAFKNASFKGPGWDTLLAEIKLANDVAIGEIHLTNEVPLFVAAIIHQVKFDNFFCEVDPYTAKIIAAKVAQSNQLELKKFRDNFGVTFSFFSFEPEFQLLQQLVKSKATINGIDQILIVADRLICSELAKNTRSASAKKVYLKIAKQSQIYFEQFLKDNTKPFYLFTPEFDQLVAQLERMPLSKYERNFIADLRRTQQIYQQQNHHLRIQQMKNNLMQTYPKEVGSKSLYKFGAIHLPKGESLMKIYDIGNLIDNLADSKYQKSLHIMVIGKSGFQASPFKGYPAQTVDENSNDLHALKPLLRAVEGRDWHCFDIGALRDAVVANKIVINEAELTRVINGYDFVIVVPEVTAARFLQ
ncbi:MAG: hypothetical protein RLY16_1976 [Bacteroidota bacterium]